MENYIEAEDYELWMLIKNDPLIPKRIKEDGTAVTRSQRNLIAMTSR